MPEEFEGADRYTYLIRSPAMADWRHRSWSYRNVIDWPYLQDVPRQKIDVIDDQDNDRQHRRHRHPSSLIIMPDCQFSKMSGKEKEHNDRWPGSSHAMPN